jgi:hypothetical protein
MIINKDEEAGKRREEANLRGVPGKEENLVMRV